MCLFQFKCKNYLEASELAKNILTKYDKFDADSEKVLRNCPLDQRKLIFLDF